MSAVQGKAITPADKRRSAAEKYMPSKTFILFVAEAPPNCSDRYFYFGKVDDHDWLWIALMKALYRSKWQSPSTERTKKKDWLERFQKDGFRLIDAVKQPIEVKGKKRIECIRSNAQERIKEIREIAPDRIILIKVTVYEALFREFQRAGLPVIDARLPFPIYHWKDRFDGKFQQLVRDNKLNLPPV